MRQVYWRTEAYEANAEDSYASCETAVNLDMRTEAGRRARASDWLFAFLVSHELQRYRATDRALTGC